MAYATPPDLVTRFGVDEMQQLSDIQTPRTGAVVPAVLEQFLADASAEIDGYLAARYPLPLATTPALLVVFACDIARYRLMSTRADDRVESAYKAAVSYLRDVAVGKIALFAADVVPAPVSGVGSVIFAPGVKEFGRERNGRRQDFSDSPGGEFW